MTDRLRKSFQVPDPTPLQVLRSFVGEFKNSESGCSMDREDAQALALAIEQAMKIVDSVAHSAMMMQLGREPTEAEMGR